MPILHIDIVTRPGESIRSEVAQELADRTGEIFGSEPGGTWVSVSPIVREAYAENKRAEEDLFPVFVSILKAKLPSPDALQVEITRLTEVISVVCDRPRENVHIIYQPEGAGRIAFGGRLVKS